MEQIDTNMFLLAPAAQDPHFPSLHNYPGNGIGGSTRGGFSQLQRDILDGNDETLSPKDFLPSECDAVRAPQEGLTAC